MKLRLTSIVLLLGLAAPALAAPPGEVPQPPSEVVALRRAAQALPLVILRQGMTTLPREDRFLAQLLPAKRALFGALDRALAAGIPLAAVSDNLRDSFEDLPHLSVEADTFLAAAKTDLLQLFDWLLERIDAPGADPARLRQELAEKSAFLDRLQLNEDPAVSEARRLVLRNFFGDLDVQSSLEEIFGHTGRQLRQRPDLLADPLAVEVIADHLAELVLDPRLANTRQPKSRDLALFAHLRPGPFLTAFVEEEAPYQEALALFALPQPRPLNEEQTESLRNLGVALHDAVENLRSADQPDAATAFLAVEGHQHRLQLGEALVAALLAKVPRESILHFLAKEQQALEELGPGRSPLRQEEWNQLVERFAELRETAREAAGGDDESAVRRLAIGRLLTALKAERDRPPAALQDLQGAVRSLLAEIAVEPGPDMPANEFVEKVERAFARPDNPLNDARKAAILSHLIGDNMRGIKPLRDPARLNAIVLARRKPDEFLDQLVHGEHVLRLLDRLPGKKVRLLP
jgi:hypothetical protein